VEEVVKRGVFWEVMGLGYPFVEKGRRGCVVFCDVIRMRILYKMG
jgi:hypothetical protein